MQSSTKVQFLYSLGVLLVSLGALFAGSFSALFDKLLENQLVLAPGSESLKNFIQPPVPITMKFYFFNVTNPEGVQYDRAKPILKEIGPYTYIKHDVKENIDFLNGVGMLQYDQRETYYFDEANSIGSEDDHVTTVNPVLVTLGSKLSSVNPIFQNFGSWIFGAGFDSPHDLFITKSIGELLFQGYHDPIIELLATVTGNSKFTEGKFSFFHQLNNSYVGKFKVNTGANGMSEHLFLQERNGEKTVDFFDTPSCNMINGTDAKQFPPHVKKKNIMQIYSESICRSADVAFVEESELYGLKTYTFGASESIFSTTDPSNFCFCRDKWFCAEGLMDISSCKEGAPVILSAPHLYRVNASIQDRVIGLSPSKEKHETTVLVEPITGIVVKGDKRLQLNFPIKRYQSIPAFEHVNDFVLPIFWVYEGATAPRELVIKLRDLTTKPFTYSYIASAAIMLIGITVILYGFWKSKDVRKDKNGEYHRQDT